jgi:hypothetical protein
MEAMKAKEGLTTKQVAERLGCARSSVRVWLNADPPRFPNAWQEETERGPVWKVPESDLIGFKVRGRGRPSKGNQAQTEERNEKEVCA